MFLLLIFVVGAGKYVGIYLGKEVAPCVRCLCNLLSKSNGQAGQHFSTNKKVEATKNNYHKSASIESRQQETLDDGSKKETLDGGCRAAHNIQSQVCRISSRHRQVSPVVASARHLTVVLIMEDRPQEPQRIDDSKDRKE